jgi:hypothetical protein
VITVEGEGDGFPTIFRLGTPCAISLPLLALARTLGEQMRWQTECRANPRAWGSGSTRHVGTSRWVSDKGEFFGGIEI